MFTVFSGSSIKCADSFSAKKFLRTEEQRITKACEKKKVFGVRLEIMEWKQENIHSFVNPAFNLSMKTEKEKKPVTLLEIKSIEIFMRYDMIFVVESSNVSV